MAANVRAEAARRRWSGRRLATELGVSPSWMSARLAGERHWRLSDVERIAAAWDVDPLQLLARDQGATWAPRGSNPQPTDSGPAAGGHLAPVIALHRERVAA